MDLSEYKQALTKFDQITAQNLAEMADWMEKNGLSWLWSELASIIRRNVKPVSQELAIRQGLETTPVDRGKMPLKPSYYVAHLTMLDTEARRICAAAVAFGKSAENFAPKATIFELQGSQRRHPHAAGSLAGDPQLV